MNSSPHDALGSYSQASNRSQSVKMVADCVELCRLWSGQWKYLFIDFCIDFVTSTEDLVTLFGVTRMTPVTTIA